MLLKTVRKIVKINNYKIKPDSIIFIINNIQKIYDLFNEFSEYEITKEECRIKKILEMSNIFAKHVDLKIIKQEHIELALESLFGTSINKTIPNKQILEQILEQISECPTEIKFDGIYFIINNIQKINNLFNKSPKHKIIKNEHRIKQILEISKIFTKKFNFKIIQKEHIEMALELLKKNISNNHCKQNLEYPTEIII